MAHTTKCGDVLPANGNNKRRSSYSEATPEAQEIEDRNADYIASTDSVSSHHSNSVVTNGDGMHSDSNLNISDKEGAAALTADAYVYVNSNARTKTNYHYKKRKPFAASSSPSSSSSSSISSSYCSSTKHNQLSLGHAIATNSSSSSLCTASSCASSSSLLLMSSGGRKSERDEKRMEQRMKSAVIANHGAPPIKVNGLKYTGSNAVPMGMAGCGQMMEHTQLETDFFRHSPALTSYHHSAYYYQSNMINNMNGFALNTSTMAFDEYHCLPLPQQAPLPFHPHLSAPVHSIYNGHVFNEYSHSPSMAYSADLSVHSDVLQMGNMSTSPPSHESIHAYYPRACSESVAPAPPPPAAPAPAPREVTKFVCIDVECAATGYGHFDQAPCRIAMTDFYGQVIFDRICKVPALMDPLKEFTGLTEREINYTRGAPLKEVLADFHSMLKRLNQRHEFGVTIIGQSLVMDLIWTQLKKGVHYTQTIDIAHEFKTKHKKWSKHTFYSLRQVAWALLQCNMNQQYHDPTEDARVTMQLYRTFCLYPEQLKVAKQRLQRIKQDNGFPDFRVKLKFPQCSAMYSPSHCKCGQKTAAHCNGVEDLDKLRKLYTEHQSKPVKHRVFHSSPRRSHHHKH
eukprot:CAMPEP_0197073282 /NCGR_PEP_ID=MMETSP1384-20130603/210524_1 /TAXON_ID=29189 /ORGANISM="Ammonia sp." /LENGTH=624 /DNA_ID=CAMNT_0042512115 /DNA_START=457 /DNA_END=2331 /DNA_ORIENTATION=-